LVSRPPGGVPTFTIVSAEPEIDLAWVAFARQAVEQLAATEPEAPELPAAIDGAIAVLRSRYPDADLEIATLRADGLGPVRRVISVYRDASAIPPGPR
jgi:hypothetical protein